jgi:HlyD family secretion protein
MDQNSLFRKSALDKLASPERLDVLMRVTSPMGWLALMTIGIVLSGVVVWSFTGDIPRRVSAQGTVTRGEGSGQITTLSGGRSEEVETGTVVARISVPAASDEAIRLKREELNALIAQNSRDKAGWNGEIGTLRLNITDWNTQIQQRNVDLEDRNREKARREESVRRGTLPATAVDEVVAQIRSLDIEITGLRQKVRTAEDRITVLRNQIQSGDGRVALVREELIGMEAGQVSNSNIASSYNGRISQVIPRAGDTVTAGSVIAFVGDASADLQVQLFVAAAEWNLVKAGQPVLITATAFPPEEYGQLVGSVTTVAELPAAQDELERVLASVGGIPDLLDQGVHIVTVAPALDPSTKSGFEWTGGVGPPDTLPAASSVGGTIDIASRRPIELIIPLLRSAVGG